MTEGKREGGGGSELRREGGREGRKEGWRERKGRRERVSG